MLTLEPATQEILKKYLLRKLKSSTEADPSIIADLTIGLIKESSSLNRTHFVESLKNFVKDASHFVDALFSRLQVEGTQINFLSGTKNSSSPMEEDFEDEDRDHKHSRKDSRSPERTDKKRKLEEKGTENESRKRSRDEKKEREDSRHRHSSSSRPRERERSIREREKTSSESTLDSRSGFFRNGNQPIRNKIRSKQRCKDYDTKGYCIQGERCNFEHGDDKIVIDSINEKEYTGYDPDKPTLPVPQLLPPNLLGYPNLNVVNTLGLPYVPPTNMNPIQSGGSMYGTSSGDNDTIVQVGGRGMNFQKEKRHKEFPPKREKNFHHLPTSQNPATSTPLANQITVYNVPKEDLTIEKLNSHFKQFGSIVNIQVKIASSKAYIQFNTIEEAEAALNSPEAVFGNRFIRTVPSRKYPTIKSDSEAVTIPIKRPFEMKSNKLTNANGPEIPTPKRPTTFKLENKQTLSKAEIQKLEKDVQEKRRFQLEQAKKLLDSLSTMKDVDPLIKSELLQKINKLSENVSNILSKDLELQNKKLEEKSKLQNLKGEKERELLDKELELLQPKSQEPDSQELVTTPPIDSTSSSETPSDTQNDSLSKLQNRYNSLQKMAASMGISSESNNNVTPARGGFKRGSFLKDRGSFPPRGRRRGRGASLAAFTLDNRPTTFSISNLPQDLKSEEALTNHFKNFGEISSLSISEEGATISFANRRMAEAAFKSGKYLQDQPLSFTWQQRSNDKSLDSTNGEASKEDSKEVVEEVYQSTHVEDSTNYLDEEEDAQDDRSWKR